MNLAKFIHNTSYHTSIGCAVTVIFHGLDPGKPSDNRLHCNCIQKPAVNVDFEESSQPKKVLSKFSTYTGGTTTKKQGRIHLQNKHFAYCWTYVWTICFQPWNYPKMASSVLKGERLATRTTSSKRAIHKLCTESKTPDQAAIPQQQTQRILILWTFRRTQIKDIIEAKKTLTQRPSFFSGWSANSTAMEQSELRRPSQSLNFLRGAPSTTKTSRGNSQSIHPRNCDCRTVKKSTGSKTRVSSKNLHHRHRRNSEDNYLNLQRNLTEPMKSLKHRDARQRYKNNKPIGWANVFFK